MKLTKFGHSCILLDDGQTKILFDPGKYSSVPDLVLDALFITHIHSDHLDAEKIIKLKQSNHLMRIFGNVSVKGELAKSNVDVEVIEAGQGVDIGTLHLEGIGTHHTIIHPEIPVVECTGFIVNRDILNPGDIFTVPPRPMRVLFLPIFAPWSKVLEMLDYITAMKPKVLIPIHDGPLKDNGAFYTPAKQWCEKYGIRFIEAEIGKEYQI